MRLLCRSKQNVVGHEGVTVRQELNSGLESARYGIGTIQALKGTCEIRSGHQNVSLQSDGNVFHKGRLDSDVHQRFLDIDRHIFAQIGFVGRHDIPFLALEKRVRSTWQTFAMDFFRNVSRPNVLPVSQLLDKVNELDKDIHNIVFAFAWLEAQEAMHEKQERQEQEAPRHPEFHSGTSLLASGFRVHGSDPTELQDHLKT